MSGLTNLPRQLVQHSSQWPEFVGTQTGVDRRDQGSAGSLELRSDRNELASQLEQVATAGIEFRAGVIRGAAGGQQLGDGAMRGSW